MNYLYFVIVYGFGLTAVLGLLASWIDRKITARVQYRVGPPLLQPFFDIIKLLGKELLIPEGTSRATFLAAPVAGFASVILVSTILWMNNLNTHSTFIGDLIVVLYLLTIPSMSLILGAFASRNPLASVGASREMKLILSYELPFLLAVSVVIIKSNFAIRLGDIVNQQIQNGAFIQSFSGVLAFIVCVFCIQAKLGLVPFDMAEAETELIGGTIIEYSGSALAIFKLMKSMLLFALPFFLVILFMGGFQTGGIGFLYSFLKYIGVLALLTVIRNTNPRVRIDHAVRFFWRKMTLLAVLAVVLAIKGF